MTQRWDAARAKSQQPARKYRPCAPVGEQPLIDWGGARIDSVHSCCGMHVCSCPPRRIPEPVRGTELPHTVAGRVSLWEELAKRGAEFKPPRKEGFRATTDGVCRCAWCDEHDPGRTKSCDHLFSVRNGLMTPKRVTP